MIECLSIKADTEESVGNSVIVQTEELKRLTATNLSVQREGKTLTLETFKANFLL